MKTKLHSTDPVKSLSKEKLEILERKELRKIFLGTEPLYIHADELNSYRTVNECKERLEEIRESFGTVKKPYATVEYFDVNEKWHITRFDTVQELDAFIAKPNEEFFHTTEKRYCYVTYFGFLRLETPKEIQNRQRNIKELQSYDTIFLKRLKNTSGQYRTHPIYSNIIRAILDTREHVPNAKERKAIRQAKAKFQKS